MSKKNLIIVGICILVIIIIGIVALIFSQTNNSGRNTGSSTSSFISSDYDSSYRQEDIFQDGVPNVTIKFGNTGKTYTVEMEDNDTATELVRNITSSGRNLPIYNYDNFDGYEYFQYYDIPTSYKIPSNATQISQEKAGELYYSSPNRVILFYQDANISGNYTKIGQINDVSGLKDAVEDNPVLQGWGNKLILINYEK